MTTNSHSNRMLPTRTVFFDDTASGLREVDSLGSILQVWAAPYADLDRMMTASRLTYGVYLIDTHEVYTGHGNGDRKIGDRVDQEGKEACQVYIVQALDPRFDKFGACYLEARLIDIAAELGVPLANRSRPFGRNGLRLSADFEQLVADAVFMLPLAGFRRFEEARQANKHRPARVMATADLHDVRVIEPEAVSIPAGAVFKRLVHRDLQAEGYQVGKRFHLLPGADFANETKSGLSEDNRLRREAIEQRDMVERLPGVTDRGRLRVGFDCSTAPIAAKIVSGEHIGNAAWQPAPRPASGEGRPA